jgi:iron complex outermembrane receptor protein
VPFSVEEHSPESDLDDRGAGVYGEGTMTFGGRVDATIGVRADRENKKATLNTFYFPTFLAPANAVVAKKDFTDVSPQFTLAYRPAPRRTLYATAARGFKAGGFNAASLPGSEAYGEEHSWNYEAGFKGSWLGDRVAVSGALFYLDWRDLQVNVPNPFVPAQFYLVNAGHADSKGFEIEGAARPLADLDFFGSLGYTSAHFGDDTSSGGVDVSGKRLPNTPNYTATGGVQYTKPVSGAASVYGRAEIVRYGDYEYDQANTAGQDAFSLAHFRAGVRMGNTFFEGWVRNAADTKYVLTAFPYQTPSGFIGENGPGRTFGIRAGLDF